MMHKQLFLKTDLLFSFLVPTTKNIHVLPRWACANSNTLTNDDVRLALLCASYLRIVIHCEKEFLDI